MEKISIQSEQNGAGQDRVWQFYIQVNDQSLLGKEFRFRLYVTVDVHDSRGINESKCLYEKIFPLQAQTHTVTIPLRDHFFYTYSGQEISIHVRAECKVDDGIIFDSKFQHAISAPMPGKTTDSESAKGEIDPKDTFSFKRNFRNIPARNKISIIIALILAIPLVLINILLGVHDQFSSQAILYNTDGSMIWSLVGGGLAGAGIYAFIRWQLRQYMTFKLKKLPGKIDRATRLRVADLITGRSTVALRDIKIRVVACNMEKGQYKRGHGTQQRTVSFKSPYRSVVLFEKPVAEIPPRMDVGFYVPDEIDFNPLFDHLYPPLITSSTHGLDVYWEVQLLHPNFVDQEVACPTDCLDPVSFISGDK